MRSANVVDPRTSANNSETSTSLPPGLLWIERMHDRQSRRFSGEGPIPKRRMMMPPGGPKGAQHSLQRGGEGRRAFRRRARSSPGIVPVSIPRHASSGDRFGDTISPSECIDGSPPTLLRPGPGGLHSHWPTEGSLPRGCRDLHTNTTRHSGCEVPLGNASAPRLLHRVRFGSHGLRALVA
jgi:hypothetical protein